MRRVGFYGLLTVVFATGVYLTAKSPKTWSPPANVAVASNDAVAARPEARKKLPQAVHPSEPSPAREPVRAEPSGSPSEDGREFRRPEGPSAPPPTRTAPPEPLRQTQNLTQPVQPPPPPTSGNRLSPSENPRYPGGGGYGGYRGNEGGGFGYEGPGGLGGRTFHGEHDRWRYDRFRGSWDFLIFPGPVFYPPAPYYSPYTPYGQTTSSHVAGVYVAYSGNDVVGSDFESALDDQLRQNDMWASSSSNASIELFIISMDEDPADAGYGSAVSVSYILLPENQFLTAQLLDVGTEQAGPLTSAVVSYATQLLDQYR